MAKIEGLVSHGGQNDEIDQLPRLSPCHEFDDRPMRVQPSWWALAPAGGLWGGLFGILSGPIVILAWMWIEHRLHGTTFYGLEVLGGPIYGGICGAVEGMALGVIWNFLFNRPRRLTIARLMLVVAITGPCLALLVNDPLLGLQAIFILPVIVVLARRTSATLMGH